MDSRFALVQAKSRQKTKIRKILSLVLLVCYFGILVVCLSVSSDYLNSIRGRDANHNAVVKESSFWRGRVKRDGYQATQASLTEGTYTFYMFIYNTMFCFVVKKIYAFLVMC